MALTAQLVDNTPHGLKYLLTQDGQVSSPPSQAADGTVTIPNDGGATPDLRTDLATTPAGQLREVVRARLDGIGGGGAGAVIPASTPLTQAQARALVNSDDNPRATLTNNLVPRAHLHVQPRTGLLAWEADVNVDVQGDPVIVARSTIGAAGTCYLIVAHRHTVSL